MIRPFAQMIAEETRYTPDLKPLVHPTRGVQADLLVPDLHAVLQQQEDDPGCVPVYQGFQLHGVVYTRELMQRMAEPFQRELLSRRQVQAICQQNYFSAQVDERVNDVLTRLLQADPELNTEVIPVFSGADLVGATRVASLILAISENQKVLYQQLETMSARLQDEVEHTADLQRQIMPPIEFRAPGLVIAGKSLASSEVSGDFIDYWMIQDRFLLLVVGDVSGHGLPAGMLSAAAKGALHTLSEAVLLTPSAVLHHLNRAIRATGGGERLMSCYVLVLDLETRIASYANAGHPFPWLVQQGEPARMLDDAYGLPLGFDANVEYEEHGLTLLPNDRLLFYTDGLLENTGPNPQDEPLDPVLVESWLEAKAHLPVANMVEDLLQWVSDHTRQHVADDVSLVCVSLSDERTSQLNGQINLYTAEFEQSNNRCRDKLLSLGRPHRQGLLEELQVQCAPQPSVVSQACLNARWSNMGPYQEGHSPIVVLERPLARQIALIRSLGITRVLNERHPILDVLGWQALIYGHPGQPFLQMERYVRPQQFWLTHSSEKEALIAQLHLAAEAAPLCEYRPDLPDLLALVADELLENAMLAHPEARSQGWHKGQDRELEGKDSVRIRFGSSTTLAALEVMDQHGSLRPDTLMERLQKNLYGVGVEEGVGGGGLFVIWSMADYLHVHIEAGHRTTVTAWFGQQGQWDWQEDMNLPTELGESTAMTPLLADTPFQITMI